MAYNKEALAIILDVGSSMNQAAPGENSKLDAAITVATMLLQRKMFAESKDEVCLVLLGSENTANDLADGESYEHVTLARPLAMVDWEMLSYLQNDVKPSTTQGDFLDAIVVAMDHVMKGIQGKRGFAHKRVILLSDMAGEFGDDQLEDIVGSLKEQSVEFNVIGPDLESDDTDDVDDQHGASNGAANGHSKAKTAQQKAGETVLKYMLQETNGECYEFEEAIAAVSYFQSRQVKPTAWKCTLDIGADLQIPVNGFIKVKEAKPKSFKNIYARDPEAKVMRARTFHLNDEEETEVEQSNTVEGHRYGSTLVPFTEEDKEQLKFRAQKCLKVCGFTKSENVKRHQFMGDSCMAFVAEKDDNAAAVALSALVRALDDQNMVAVVRRVYSNSASVRLGCLFPRVKSNYECLIYHELPFAEDIRTYEFGSLPVSHVSDAINKKFEPSAAQLSAMDDLINNMDLSKQEGDDESEEVLKPKMTFNPYLQRLYQCMQHRVLNPDDPIPELSPLVAEYLKPPQEVVTKCEATVDKMKQLFKLEEIAKKKEKKTGQNMFQDGGDGPDAKKPKIDDNLSGGIASLTKSKVTEVGTVNPIDDFRTIISDDKEKFKPACDKMKERILQIVMDSFGSQFYGKALDCLKALKEECINHSDGKLFNDFLQDVKLEWKTSRKDFWQRVVSDGLTLITDSQCASGGVSKEAAESFIAPEQAQSIAAQDEPEEEDPEALMDMF